MNEYKTQNEILIAYMKSGGTLTANPAYNPIALKHGIGDIRKRVSEIRCDCQIYSLGGCYTGYILPVNNWEVCDKWIKLESGKRVKQYSMRRVR